MDNFETLLKEKGLTKTAFAEMLGVKKQNINGLMKNPTMETIRRFASVLEVPVWRLFVSDEDINGNVNGFIEYDGIIYKIRSRSDIVSLLDRMK